MKISKIVAETITQELCSKREKEIAELKEQIEKEIDEEIWRILPESVSAAYKAHPQYFSRNSISIRDDNRKYWYISITSPNKQGNSDINHYGCDVNKVEDWKKRFCEIGNLETDLRKKRSDLFQIILSMKTSNRLKENFEEAFFVLKEKYPSGDITAPSMLPATQMKELINWLKK